MLFSLIDKLLGPDTQYLKSKLSHICHFRHVDDMEPN